MLVAGLDRPVPAAFWLSSTTACGGAEQSGSSRDSTPGRSARAPSRPSGATSSAARGRPLLGVGWPPCAGRRRPPRRVRLGAAGKKGPAAAGAAERERVRTLGIVGVHPIHHRVSSPARAPGPLVEGDIPRENRFDDRLLRYGYTAYRQLFNARQSLHLGLLARALDRIGGPSGEALRIAFSDHLSTNNVLCAYAGGWRRLAPLFSIRAYRHIARPVELNPWLIRNGRGTFPNAVRSVIRAARWLKEEREPTVDGGMRQVRSYPKPMRWDVRCGDARDLAISPRAVLTLF